jgi:subtilase-type serine protease
MLLGFGWFNTLTPDNISFKVFSACPCWKRLAAFLVVVSKAVLITPLLAKSETKPTGPEDLAARAAAVTAATQATNEANTAKTTSTSTFNALTTDNKNLANEYKASNPAVSEPGTASIRSIFTPTELNANTALKTFVEQWDAFIEKQQEKFAALADQAAKEAALSVAQQTEIAIKAAADIAAAKAAAENSARALAESRAAAQAAAVKEAAARAAAQRSRGSAQSAKRCDRCPAQTVATTD